ncbi:MAG: hypothetical protein KDA20_02365 [Phycisphaerales bacterium]|nr:hypothetical protein [Phycisphaerales bacterium]
MASRTRIHIDRRRLNPVGSGRPDAVTWAKRLGTLAIVLAGGIVGWAAFGPLATPIQADAPRLPSIQSVRLPDAPAVNARREQMAAMSSAHLFSRDRATWGLTTEPEQAIAQVEPEPVRVEAPSGATQAEVIVVHVDDPEEVDKQVRDSFETIRLRAIVTLREQTPAALLSYAHSRTVDRAERVAEGDQFIVPRQKDKGEDEWTLLRVDTVRNRIYVRHGKTTLGIPLFPDDTVESGQVTVAAAAAPESPADVPVAAAPAMPKRTADGRPVPRVLREDQAHALEQIRKRAEELESRGSITPDDLAELMALTAKPHEAEQQPAKPATEDTSPK